MKRLTEELNLTDAQQTKVLDILQKNSDKKRREFETERQAMEKHFREMRQKAPAEREAVDKEIESVLNADQKAKFAQLRQERENRMKHRPHKHHHAQPAAEGEK